MAVLSIVNLTCILRESIVNPTCILREYYVVGRVIKVESQKSKEESSRKAMRLESIKMGKYLKSYAKYLHI